MSKTIDEIRPKYIFDISCQGSVSQSITTFLESDNYEDAVRKAVSLGGNANTMACVAGEIAEAFYEPIPEDISLEARKRLPNKFLKITDKFYEVIREQENPCSQEQGRVI